MINKFLMNKKVRVTFVILCFVFLGHHLFINYSDSNYAVCQRLRNDKIHFEYYRDTERPVYQQIMEALTDEQLQLNCG